MINLNFRQGIINIPKNKAFAQISSGSVVLTLPSNSKAQYSASHGVAEYLLEEFVSSPAISLPYLNNYVYIDVDMTTAKTSYGVTNFNLLYGYEFPESPEDDQHYFNLTDNIMYYWNGNYWIDCIRVFIINVNDSRINYFPIGNTQVANTSHCISSKIVFEQPLKPYVRYVSDTKFLFLTHHINKQNTNLKKSNQILYDRVLQYQPIAGEDIPKGYCVGFDTDSTIKISTDENSIPVIGICGQAVASGQPIKIIDNYMTYYNEWLWNVPPLTALFVSASGSVVLTSDRLNSIQKIGKVIDNHSIQIDISPQILKLVDSES